MPIYEYECPKCGLFEVIQGAGDKPLKARPDCTEKNCPKNAHKVISQSAFHLKGSGWYKTDYASTGSAGKAKTKKAEGTSDTKPAESKAADTKAKSSDASS